MVRESQRMRSPGSDSTVRSEVRTSVGSDSTLGEEKRPRRREATSALTLDHLVPFLLPPCHILRGVSVVVLVSAVLLLLQPARRGEEVLLACMRALHDDKATIVRSTPRARDESLYKLKLTGWSTTGSDQVSYRRRNHWQTEGSPVGRE